MFCELLLRRIGNLHDRSDNYDIMSWFSTFDPKYMDQGNVKCNATSPGQGFGKGHWCKAGGIMKLSNTGDRCVHYIQSEDAHHVLKHNYPAILHTWLKYGCYGGLNILFDRRW